VQAASRGVLDFTKLDLRQRKTWNKIKWVTSNIVTEHLSKLTELKLLKQHAVLDYSSARSTIEHHWRAADTLFKEYQTFVLPWVDTKIKTDEDTVAELREQYADAFGDPDSSEFQEEMQKIIDEWTADSEKPQ
tara:strand:+ start:173 stop:571 length:399 start_codon:yes stop_codon:yes gene_type:complete